MASSAFSKTHLTLIVFLSLPTLAQISLKKDSPSREFSNESVVLEQSKSTLVFQNDGTFVNDQYVRARIQSDAGVRQYGTLSFPYQASTGTVEVRDVRVIKPNGDVVVTELNAIQDVTSEISRLAPSYTDIREKHVPVKGLEPGDTLEFSARIVTDKPLIPGQFWAGLHFQKTVVALDEQMEINVPRDRRIKVKSQTIQPTMREEGSRTIYLWKTSNLVSRSLQKQGEMLVSDAMRGQLPPPDVLISSFRTWEEVGRWYEGLQREKSPLSPEIKAKADELTKGLTDDDAKLRAIYNYVSLHYRYISIGFGIGRYQPHTPAEILGNQYGDCKDKHTLLAALLSAVGIHAYPALINSRIAIDPDVPSPGQFDHVISVVAKGNTLSWMDTTPEVTPMGFLVRPLRGKSALVITPEKVALQTTPANPPFPNRDISTLTAKLDTDGTLQARSESVFRGDDEPYFRSTYRRIPESQWKDFGQRDFYAGRMGGTITNVQVSAPEKTDEPFSLSYDYTLKDFAGGAKHRFSVPLPPLALPELKDEDMQRMTPLWLGHVGEAVYESRIELPKGWSASPPIALDLKESFAEFQGSSEMDGNTFVTKRRLVLTTEAITPDQLKDYKVFQRAISDDHNLYISLRLTQEAQLMTQASASTLNSQPSPLAPHWDKGIVEGRTYKNPTVGIEFTPAPQLQFGPPELKGTPGALPLLVTVTAAGEPKPSSAREVTAFYTEALASYPNAQRTTEAYMQRMVEASRKQGIIPIDSTSEGQIDGITFARQYLEKGLAYEAVLVKACDAQVLVFIFGGANRGVVDQLMHATKVTLDLNASGCGSKSPSQK